MKFFSPTRGPMTFDEMFADLSGFIHAAPEDAYKLIVGTDSQLKDETCFVTAVIIHRLGKGARFYYTKKRQPKVTSLRQRIFYEASLSLSLAGRLAEHLARNGHAGLDVEIHLDVGQQGETRDLIREVVGMITGSGFDAKIKPESYGASKVADKYTK